MKKVIKSSYMFQNIDGHEFVRDLVVRLKSIDDNKYGAVNTTNKDGYQITLYDMDSQEELESVLEDTLSAMGYDVYDITDADDEGYQYAAVKGDAFVKLIADVGDYFNNGTMGYIELKFDNGNVLFQDWYED